MVAIERQAQSAEGSDRNDQRCLQGDLGFMRQRRLEGQARGVIRLDQQDIRVHAVQQLPGPFDWRTVNITAANLFMQQDELVLGQRFRDRPRSGAGRHRTGK